MEAQRPSHLQFHSGSEFDFRRNAILIRYWLSAFCSRQTVVRSGDEEISPGDKSCCSVPFFSLV
jgi:hypothetical protein